MKGAVEYCKAKRLTKNCLYEKKQKYLVLVSDKVEHLGNQVLFLPFGGFPQTRAFWFGFGLYIWAHGCLSDVYTCFI